MMENDALLRILRDTQARYQDIFNHVTDLIHINDPAGQLMYVNPKWRRTLGYPDTNVTTLNISQIIHPDAWTKYEAVVHQLTQAQPEAHIETAFITRDGRKIRLDGSLKARTVAGQIADIRGIFYNISERKQEQRQLQTQALRSRELYDIATAQELNLEGKIAIMLDTGAALLGMDRAAIMQLTGDELRVIYSAPGPNRPFLRVGTRYAVDQMFDEFVVRSGEMLSIEHIGHTRYQMHPAYAALQIESYVGVPLFVEESIFGTLNFMSKQPVVRPFDAYDMDFVRLISQWINSLLSQHHLVSYQTDLMEQLAIYMDYTYEGYYESDVNGILHDFNDALCDIAGYSRRELTGRSHAHYLTPAGAERLKRAYDTVFQTKLPVRDVICELKTPTRGQTHVAIAVIPRLDSYNRAIGCRGLVRYRL